MMIMVMSHDDDDDDDNRKRPDQVPGLNISAGLRIIPWTCNASGPSESLTSKPLNPNS